MSDVPPVELGPARAGDVGTVIVLAIQERDLNGVLIPVDLTEALEVFITIERPDGTTVTKTATVLGPPVAGQIQIVLELGDLTEPGRFPLQGWMNFPAGATWSTSEAVLIVDRSL